MKEYSHDVKVNISLNSIIKYGVRDNYIDVTQLCRERCVSGDRIIIPAGDHPRANIFGDPIPFILKSIFVERPIYGLYFISCTGDYLNIVHEQLQIIVNSSLYNETKNILLFICSYNDNFGKAYGRRLAEIRLINNYRVRNNLTKLEEDEISSIVEIEKKKSPLFKYTITNSKVDQQIEIGRNCRKTRLVMSERPSLSVIFLNSTCLSVA
jgi:hypothetical protein